MESGKTVEEAFKDRQGIAYQVRSIKGGDCDGGEGGEHFSERVEQVLCLSASMTEVLIEIQTPGRVFGRTIPLMPRLRRAEVLPGERLPFKG